MSSESQQMRNAALLSPIDVLSSVDSMLEPIIESWSRALSSTETQAELRKIHTASHSVLHSVQAYMEAVTAAVPSLGITDSRIDWGIGIRVSELDVETGDPEKICRLSMIACLSLAFRINSEFRQLEAGNFKTVSQSQPLRQLWDGGTVIRIRSLCRELIRCLEELDFQLEFLNKASKYSLDSPKPISGRSQWSSHYRAARTLLEFGYARAAIDRGLEGISAFIRSHLEVDDHAEIPVSSSLLRHADGLTSLAHSLEQAEKISLKGKPFFLGLSTLAAENLIHEMGVLIAGGLDPSQIHSLKRAYADEEL